MKIGIIIGSTRDNRMGASVGEWVMAQTEGRTDATYELVDLADYNLPMLTTAMPPVMLNGQYAADVQPWADKIANFNIYDIRNNVGISLVTDVKDGALAPAEYHLAEVKDLFDTLIPAATAMATLR